jgi:predicted alpha/beta-fold hydrolase
LIANDAFRPAPWLPGPHLQSIVPSLWVGPPVEGPVEQVTVRVADRSAVRLDINRPRGAAGATLLLVHGMCGNSESAYMRRTARAALRRGWVAARMNLRNCGGTESLSDTLYNAGQAEDVGRVLETLASTGFPRPLYAAGFSLGGNLVLLHAGREGDGCAADGVAAVNPPIELEVCAGAIELPGNAIYRTYYVVRLCRQLRRVAAVRGFPGPLPLARRVRTVRRFDELYTAPDGGYASAREYYARSSAAPTLAGVRRPALVVSALDDPFVPAGIFTPHHGNATLRFVHPRAGGHCGYWQAGSPRSWAAQAILEFFESN